MAAKTKVFTMEVTVRVPAVFNKTEAKREVRSLINDECGYAVGKYDASNSWIEMKIKTVKIK